MAVVEWERVEDLIDRALEKACDMAGCELGDCDAELVLRPGWEGELRLVWDDEEEHPSRTLVHWETDIEMLHALRAFV